MSLQPPAELHTPLTYHAGERLVVVVLHAHVLWRAHHQAADSQVVRAKALEETGYVTACHCGYAGERGEAGGKGGQGTGMKSESMLRCRKSRNDHQLEPKTWKAMSMPATASMYWREEKLGGREEWGGGGGRGEKV